MNPELCRRISSLISECLNMADASEVHFSIALETLGDFDHRIWFASGGKLKHDLMIGALRQEMTDTIFHIPQKCLTESNRKLENCKFESWLDLDLKPRTSESNDPDYGEILEDTNGWESEDSGGLCASETDDLTIVDRVTKKTKDKTLNSEDGVTKKTKVKTSEDRVTKKTKVKTSEDARTVKSSDLCAAEDERPHVCPQCSKSFTSPNKLQVHLKIHSADKTFICLECPKSFRKSSNLKRHLNTHSEFKVMVKSPDVFTPKVGATPNECPQCSMSFPSSNHLKVHLKIHTVHRRHICDQCPKSFTKSSHLKRHLYTHSEERQFQCHKCELCMKSRDQLQSHLETHEQTRKHACPMCDKKFVTRKNLMQHKKFHSPPEWECKACFKRFAHKHMLKNHLRQFHKFEAIERFIQFSPDAVGTEWKDHMPKDFKH